MEINGVEVHLAINHFPILLSLIGAAVLAIGVFLRLRQTQVVGLCIVVCGALAAIPTYLSGTPARNIAQNYPVVTELAVVAHQQAAFYAFIALEVVGVVACYLLWQFAWRKSVSRRSLAAILVLTLVAFSLLARTAHLGGRIRHEELERGSF